MNRGTKVKMTRDKLEVCYVGKKELIDNIEDTKYWLRDGYYLKYEEIENKDKRETILSIWVDDWNQEKGLYQYKFGTLKFGNSFESENDNIRYCWLRVENDVLYRTDKPLYLLYWIQDDLGLEFNNFTSIDIALDSNICWFKRIKSAIKNENLVPVVLNKSYTDMREKIKPIGYWHVGDRIKYRENTMYISNIEKDMVFTTYDKGEEIKESGKDYIRNWYGSNGNIYRAEIRLKNKSINDYCEKNKLSQYELYMRLEDENILFDIYLFFCNRVIRFIDNSRTPISFLQL